MRKWTGTRQANQFGPAAPQLPAGWLPHVAWKEDCLYLNIWTAQFWPNEKLPVIVFFHGGGNEVGCSQATPLGPPLSRLGVVVVSANYRLGPFGFFAHPAVTAESEHHSSGNYGLLDQVQALRWVRDNISHFGGDPNRVTVMGQSAGALDITLLMASPLAVGLFQGAILESGEAQPARIFAEGKQLKIPVLVGSNADEATVFGLVAPKSVDEYKAFLQRDTGRFANQEFAACPLGSDASIPEQFLKYHNDLFSYGAYSLARTMTHWGQNAYLYLFTYAEKGKRAKLGAYHGEELYFLSNSYPTDWEHDGDDERLGQAIRAYWVQFAKTGNPNSNGSPEWPAYEVRKDQYLELGRRVGLRQVPERLKVLGRIMEEVVADATGSAAPTRSN